MFLVDKTFWWGCTLPSFQKWSYVPGWMSFMENKLGLFQNLKSEFQFCRILLLWSWLHCISISTSWKLFWCEALLFLITLKQKILMIFISDIYVWEIQFLYFHLIYLKVPMLVHNNALDVLSIGRQKHGPFNR